MMLETIYQEEKTKILDANYEKHLRRTLKEIQKEYVNANKDIEKEISKWLLDMDMIKQNNPNFQFSELQHLQDLQKQINLIIDELAKAEERILTGTLKELYVTDYVDLNKLNTEYGLLELNTPLPQFNQIQSIHTLESYVMMPNISKQLVEIAKGVPVEMVGDAISGRWFNTRIKERAEKLRYSIENTIRQGIIRGDSYNKVADRMSRTLFKGTKEEMAKAYNSCKTLVRTEMAVAENKAEVHQAMKMGMNGMKWVAYHGSDNGFQKNVCEKCRKMDGTIYKTTEVKMQDLIAHPNCRCILQPCKLDENGKEVKSMFEDDMMAYADAKAKERVEQMRKLKEDAYNKRKKK